MSELAANRPIQLYARTKVSAADERVFIAMLALLSTATGVGVMLSLRPEPVSIVAGVIVLAAMFAHAVELQHQCLHHSAFRHAWLHRVVGVPLGIPLMVVYSHYRLRHLQHRQWLGTVRDIEFFGFDARQRITAGHLLRGLFDYRRLAQVGADVLRADSGRCPGNQATISPKTRQRIVGDHLILGVVVVAMIAVDHAAMSVPINPSPPRRSPAVRHPRREQLRRLLSRTLDTPPHRSGRRVVLMIENNARRSRFNADER